MTAAKRPPPCRCGAHPFPHRADYWCAELAWGSAPVESDETIEQQQREWNADRAQDARAINGGGQ